MALIASDSELYMKLRNRINSAAKKFHIGIVAKKYLSLYRDALLG